MSDWADGVSDSGGFDFLGTVGNVGGAVLDVAKTALNFQALRDSNAYQRQIAMATQNAELAKINGGVEIEKLRAAQAIAQQRNLLNQSPLLGGFYPMGSGGSSDTLMLILTAAGVFFAWKALKK